MSSKANRRQARRAKSAARQKQRARLGWVLATLVFLASAYFVVTESRLADPLADAETIALGRQVYVENCASCHGFEGEGHVDLIQAPALDETEHAWHHPDGQLQDLLTNGGTLMPPFGDQLTDEEILAVIRYFQTWWTADQIASQQQASQSNPIRQPAED